jgi:hypothetical protein
MASSKRSSRFHLRVIHGPPAECDTLLHTSLYYTLCIHNEHPWLLVQPLGNMAAGKVKKKTFCWHIFLLQKKNINGFPSCIELNVKLPIEQLVLYTHRKMHRSLGMKKRPQLPKVLWSWNNWASWLLLKMSQTQKLASKQPRKAKNFQGRNSTTKSFIWQQTFLLDIALAVVKYTDGYCWALHWWVLC